MIIFLFQIVLYILFFLLLLVYIKVSQLIHYYIKGGNSDGKWLKPNGELWKIDLQSPPDENDAFRMANAASDMWSDFGIEVNLQGLERSVWNQNRMMGQYDISTPWTSLALASGDAWPNVRGLHTDYYVPVGQECRSKGGTDCARLNNPVLSEFIDKMEKFEKNSPLVKILHTSWSFFLYRPLQDTNSILTKT